MSIKIAYKDKLLEKQKNLIKIVSFATAFLTLSAGSALQALTTKTFLSYPVIAGLTALFFLTGCVAHFKKISAQVAETMLALMGSLVISKILTVYYTTGLSPIWLTCYSLLVLGLSGAFINKSSLVLIKIPGTIFIIYESLYPAQNPVFNSSMAFILLLTTSLVGYLLTWQKVHLINTSLDQEIYKNTVIHNLHEGVILRDSDGVIVAINPVIRKMFGKGTKGVIVGRSLIESNLKFFKADGVTLCPNEELPDEVALRTGLPVKNFPVVFFRSDNSQIHIEITATPILSASQPDTVEFILTTFRDITDIKNAQAVIENHKLQMLAHSKLTALGEMASGIAHEINNPLTIILGRTQHLSKSIENGSATNPEIIQTLSKISDTALRIAKIVKSMRSLARESRTDEFEKSNLKTIIENIVNVSNDSILKNEITIHLELDSAIEIDCDPGLISQVFINLFKNAIDALSDQAQTNTESRWIRIVSERRADRVLISFHDSGHGIPAAIKDKIMLPFFTTKEAGKGTGIGLSLCRSIIENHKGRFYVDETAPNTCFTIDLPIIQDRPVSKMAA